MEGRRWGLGIGVLGMEDGSKDDWGLEDAGFRDERGRKLTSHISTSQACHLRLLRCSHKEDGYLLDLSPIAKGWRGSFRRVGWAFFGFWLPSVRVEDVVRGTDRIYYD